MQATQKINRRQTGFSLVELLVGLVIGLFATLVIMQIFSAFEGQKRSTSGAADTQTNGAIALMYLQRSLQSAGFGMPMPNTDLNNNVLKCTSNIDIFPVEVQDGAGSNGSDKLIVRYSTGSAGMVPINIDNVTNVSPGMLVTNNIGCGSDLEMSNATYQAKYRDPNDATDSKAPNRLMIMAGNTCAFAEIAAQPTNTLTGQSYIRLHDIASLPFAPAVGNKLACMGAWGDYTYEINNNNELELNGDAILSGVVAMQVQYGISAAPGLNEVTQWVDAVGAWAAPVVPARNRIKAVRVSLALRNGLKEKTEVTSAAPEAWTDAGTTLGSMSVAHLADWKNYRYRVVSTSVPLRNMLWSWRAVQ
ncbi:MAG: PilW family protein [Methylophilaceae bacterium]